MTLSGVGAKPSTRTGSALSKFITAGLLSQQPKGYNKRAGSKSGDVWVNPARRRARKESVSILKCYQVLGLSPGATLRQVHRAYKKLVLRHHPDRTAGDANSLAVFVEVTEAYATLKRAFAMRETSQGAGQCPKCERFAQLLRGLDNERYCADCLLSQRRKFLPLPTFEQVKCIGVIALQGAALYLTIKSIIEGSLPHGVAALVLVVLSLGVLAYDFLTADVIER